MKGGRLSVEEDMLWQQPFCRKQSKGTGFGGIIISTTAPQDHEDVVAHEGFIALVTSVHSDTDSSPTVSALISVCLSACRRRALVHNIEQPTLTSL